jgi:hypothetical protein
MDLSNVHQNRLNAKQNSPGRELQGRFALSSARSGQK